jgi:hypothetical protein
MKRVLLSGMLLTLLGCTVPAERVPLRPLPENGQVLPYAELLTRVRAQASTANEAFYLDRWNDLEDMAKGIEQTARFLSKAEEVPKKNKDLLTEVTGELAKNAKRLRDAATARNVKDATEALQQINLKVRQLRLTDDGADRPKEGTNSKGQ